MKLTRKIVLISIILLAAYTTHVSAEVGDLLMSTGYKSLDVGESWNLEESYVLTINQISKDGTKIWLSLSKYNSEIDSEVLSKGETYVYEVEIGSKEYNILRATVGEMDKESRTVRLDSVRQYSDENVAVTSAPTPTTTQQDSSSEIITSSAINSFFAPPETQPSGLAYDGTYLWLSSYKKNGGIYKLNPDDGSVSRKYMPPVSQYDGYGGITYDGSHLWQVDRYEGKLYKLNPSDCSIISSISGPDKSPSGLTWDGKYLWTYGYPSYKIYKINPSDGTIIATFDPPSGIEQNAGLAFDGTYMWISGGSYLHGLNGYIYKLNPSDCSVISAYEAPCSRPISLTWDGKYLWCASFDGGKIYQLEVGESALAGTTASSTVKLIFPLNGAVMDNGRTDRRDSEVWDFDWSDVESASGYQLYVKKDTAENLAIDTMTTSSSYHYVNSGSYMGDRNCYGWTWKVRAQVNGQWGEWSETRNFQVEKVNTDRPSQTVTQPTLAPTPVRTPSTTRYVAPVATSATSTSQQSETSKIFPVLLILGLLCVVGYVLVRSSPDGVWTAKLIDTVKYTYHRSESDGMQMSNKNARLWPDKKVGGAIGGAIPGVILFVFAISAIISNGVSDSEFYGELLFVTTLFAIGGAVCGAFACGAFASMGKTLVGEEGTWVGAVYVGGIGSAVIASAFYATTEGILQGVLGFIFFIVIGAIMGAITGVVGKLTGGVSNKMREKQLQHRKKQLQYRKTVPGLFDTAKKLSTEANTLFKQENYTKALQTYNDALDNFNKASKGALATGDVNLVGIITNNTTTIEENIVMCKNLIGTRITEEAKNRFELGNFRGALQSYEEALPYLKDPDLVAKANDSIEICYREIDVGKVEELSNRAVSLLNEATSITESFKARDMLKQADDVIDKAVAIAMKRNFTEAHQQLNMISKNIRTQRNVIDDRMADGGEVVSGGYGVGKVTGKTGPSISTIASEKPIIKRETEFFSGFIRLKMAVINPMNQIITDVSIDLDFDENTFRLDRYEPESYSMKKGKVQLGTINPGTSKTVAFYLDPMTCAKVGTDINCRMDYKDAYGKPDSMQMKSKKEKWVCPEFRTENDINIGMLKEFIENLPHHDSKFYKIPTGLETNKLIEICRETIQMHDVRHVRTFHTTDDKNCETWYYGKTKVYKSDIVIKASIKEETESIEIFAATPDNESLTGLLAELGHNLTKKIGEISKKPTPIINVSIRDVINTRGNLLNFCDMDGVCIGNVTVEDSVIYKSNVIGGTATDASSVNTKDSIVHRLQIGSAGGCPHCGKEVQAAEKFCTDCGGRLG